MSELKSAIFSSTYQILVAITVCLISYNFLRHIWRKRHLYWTSFKCYGPPGLPFIGHLYLAPKNLQDVLYVIEDKLKQYNKFPSSFWIGPEMCVPLTTPELVKKVLNSPDCFLKGEVHNAAVVEILGDNTINSTNNYDIWKFLRKTFNPYFGTTSLLKHIDIYNKHSKELTNILEKVVGKDDVDTFEIICGTNISFILEMAVNHQMESPEEASRFLLLMKRCLEITMLKMFIPILHIHFFFKLTPIYKTQQENLKGMNDIIYKMIEKRRKELKELENKNDEERVKKEFFLDPLFIEYKFSDLHLRNQIVAFAFSTSDTITTTVSFALLCLSVLQERQADVYKVLKEMYGEDLDSPITVKDLEKLDLLERCIKESLRMFPVTAAIGRTNTKEIEINGFKFPPGICFFDMIYNIHMNPKYFKDPWNYNPDRFLPEEYAKIEPNAYHPFTIGPRNCLGNRISMIVTKVQIAQILRKYHITNTKYTKLQDVKLDWKMMLVPVNGYGIKYNLRHS